MSEGWVLNASPIIALAKVDRLDLLEGLMPEICIPPAVVEEITQGRRRILDVVLWKADGANGCLSLVFGPKSWAGV